jgi:hypothetical protein
MVFKINAGWKAHDKQDRFAHLRELDGERAGRSGFTYARVLDYIALGCTREKGRGAPTPPFPPESDADEL